MDGQMIAARGGPTVGDRVKMRGSKEIGCVTHVEAPHAQGQRLHVRWRQSETTHETQELVPVETAADVYLKAVYRYLRGTPVPEDRAPLRKLRQLLESV